MTKHKESCTPLTYIYESVIMSIIALIYQCYPQTSPYFPKPPDTPPLNMAQNTFYGSNIRCSQTERFTTGISPVTFDGGTESKVKVWEKFPFSVYIPHKFPKTPHKSGTTSSAALGKLFCASVSQAFPLKQCLFKDWFFYIWF